MTPAYLQDSRPDFAPFEIDCGKIPAFRFQGNLRSELAAGRIDGATATGLLEDMLMIRELEEMIVTVRSGAYEPLTGFQLSRSHARFHWPGRSFRGSVQRPDPEGSHHQHAPRPRRQPGAGCCALREMPMSAAEARSELQSGEPRRTSRTGLGRACLSHHCELVRQRGRLLPGARRQHAHCRLYGGPSGGERHCGRRRAHRHRRGDGFALPARRRRGVLLCRRWRLLQRRGSGIAELGGPGAVHQ
jgi:hypothetical protein